MTIARSMAHFLLPVFLFLSGVVSVAHAAVGVNQTEEGLIVVENMHLRAVIDPGMGGRIKELINKSLDRNILPYFKPALGGAFDDRGLRTQAVYQAEILKSDLTTAIVRLSYEAEGDPLAYEKTFSVFERNPLIRADYRITNRSDVPTTVYIMLKTVPTPAGDIGAEDFYVFPRIQGIERISYDGIRQAYTSAAWLKDLSGAWSGMVNAPTKAGFAVVLDAASLEQVYVCHARPPTFEWIYEERPLMPAETFETTVLFCLTKGFDSFVEANKHFIADLSAKVDGRDVTLKQVMFPTLVELDLLERPQVETTILDSNRREVATLPLFSYALIWQLGAQDQELHWTAPDDGTYIAVQKVEVAGNEIASYEIPFVIGTPRGTYQRAPLRASRVEEADSGPSYRVRPADIERGFIIHRHDPSAQLEAIGHQPKLSLHLGCDDTETFGLELLALRQLTPLLPKLSPLVDEAGTTLESGNLRIHVEKDFRMLEESISSLEPGQSTSLWITIGTQSSSPGRYTASLNLTAQDSVVASIALELQVYDVTVPAEPSLDFVPWQAHMFRHPQIAANDPQRIMKLWPRYARDLAEHRAVGFTLSSKVELQLFVKPTGRLKEGFIPIMDFSGLDEFFDIMLAHDLREMHLYYGWPTWPDPDIELTDAQNWQLSGEHLRQLCEYAISRGIEYIGIMDFTGEVVGAERTVSETVEILKLACGAHPLVHPGPAISQFTLADLQAMSPYVRDWTFGLTSALPALGWIESGKLPLAEGSRLGFYGGGWHPYRNGYYGSRARGWYSHILGVTSHKYFLYGGLWENHMGQLPLPGPDGGPVPTPAWEGIRDGNIDYEYLLMAKRLIDTLAEKVQDRRASEAQEEALTWAQEQFAMVVGPQAQSPESCVTYKHNVHLGASNITLAARQDFRAGKRLLLEIIERLQHENVSAN